MKGLYFPIRGPAVGKLVTVLLLASFSPQVMADLAGGFPSRADEHGRLLVPVQPASSGFGIPWLETASECRTCLGPESAGQSGVRVRVEVTGARYPRGELPSACRT